RTGGERVVEREQSWLRRFLGDSTAAALEALREDVPLAGVGVHREGCATTFAIRRLDRVGQAASQVTLDAKAIDDHFKAAARPQRGEVDILERGGTAIHQQPAEPA